MILANKLCYFEWCMERVGRPYHDIGFICDPDADHTWDPRLRKHSMWLARGAALHAGLPPWFLKGLKKTFPCSCRVWAGIEKAWQIAISHEESRGKINEAQDLRLRLRGQWDFDLFETAEQACGDDPGALEICRERFERWEENGDRTELHRLQSFWEFLSTVTDPLLVALARETLRVEELARQQSEVEASRKRLKSASQPF